MTPLSISHSVYSRVGLRIFFCTSKNLRCVTPLPVSHNIYSRVGLGNFLHFQKFEMLRDPSPPVSHIFSRLGLGEFFLQFRKFEYCVTPPSHRTSTYHSVTSAALVNSQRDSMPVAFSFSTYSFVSSLVLPVCGRGHVDLRFLGFEFTRQKGKTNKTKIGDSEKKCMLRKQKICFPEHIVFSPNTQQSGLSRV